MEMHFSISWSSPRQVILQSISTILTETIFSSFQINSVSILLSVKTVCGEEGGRGKKKRSKSSTPYGTEKYQISCLGKRYALHLLSTQLQLKALLSCSCLFSLLLLNINRGDAFLCPTLPYNSL